MAHASPPQTSRDRLAEARVRFLTADSVDSNAVRKPILASWWRSRQWHVAVEDGHGREDVSAARLALGGD